jgi:hypothetical protein
LTATSIQVCIDIALMAFAVVWTSMSTGHFLSFFGTFHCANGTADDFCIANIECFMDSCVVDSTTRKCGKAGLASSSSDTINMSVAYLFVLSFAVVVVLAVAMVLL